MTSFEYDKLGNVVCTTDALDGQTSRVYDANGNLLSETDVLGNTSTYTYNKLGWVTSVTDTRGGVTAIEYDENGNIVEITDTYEAGNNLIYVPSRPHRPRLQKPTPVLTTPVKMLNITPRY